MRSARKVAIIGCGAIGTSLARIISRDLAGSFTVIALYDIDRGKAMMLSKRVCGSGRCVKESMQEAVCSASLVIEAASAASSWEIARTAVSQGKDVLVMSVGGILAHAKRLEMLAARKGVAVLIPSGAVAGIDALRACRETKIGRVTLTTRKNPASFIGNQYLAQRGIKPGSIRKETVLFSGSARDAVKRFPQNINVAAVVSLAGNGPVKTRVTIIADPSVRNNIHEVVFKSKAGDVVARTQNVVHPDNPKTSYLAVLSAAAVLRQVARPIKIG